MRLKAPKSITGQRLQGIQRISHEEQMHSIVVISNKIADPTKKVSLLDARIYRSILGFIASNREVPNDIELASEFGLTLDAIEDSIQNLVNAGLITYRIPDDQRQKFEAVLGRRLTV